jgi:hypothetical protein
MAALTARCVVTLVVALLGAHLLGSSALAAPAALRLDDRPLVTGAVFQNACHAAREEEARAEAEGREPEDVVTSNLQTWRRALSDFSRSGPAEPRFCWSPAQVPSDDPMRSR